MNLRQRLSTFVATYRWHVKVTGNVNLTEID